MSATHTNTLAITAKETYSGRSLLGLELTLREDRVEERVTASTGSL